MEVKDAALPSHTDSDTIRITMGHAVRFHRAAVDVDGGGSVSANACPVVATRGCHIAVVDGHGAVG